MSDEDYHPQEYGREPARSNRASQRKPLRELPVKEQELQRELEDFQEQAELSDEQAVSDDEEAVSDDEEDEQMVNNKRKTAKTAKKAAAAKHDASDDDEFDEVAQLKAQLAKKEQELKKKEKQWKDAVNNSAELPKTDAMEASITKVTKHVSFTVWKFAQNDEQLVRVATIVYDILYDEQQGKNHGPGYK